MKPKPSEVIADHVNTPASRTPTTDEARHAAGTMRPLRADLEAAIKRVLYRPPEPDETQRTCGGNRERELGELFAEMTPVEAYDLGRRLDANRNDDDLAVAFRRLLLERRLRLRATLASVVQRAAVIKSARS